MEYLTDIDEYLDAMRKVDLTLDLNQHDSRGFLLENKQLIAYNKAQAILNVPEMIKAHKKLLDMPFLEENLSEEELQIVDKLYDLGRDRGFLNDFNDMEGAEDEGIDGDVDGDIDDEEMDLTTIDTPEDKQLYNEDMNEYLESKFGEINEDDMGQQMEIYGQETGNGVEAGLADDVGDRNELDSDNEEKNPTIDEPTGSEKEYVSEPSKNDDEKMPFESEEVRNGVEAGLADDVGDRNELKADEQDDLPPAKQKEDKTQEVDDEKMPFESDGDNDQQNQDGGDGSDVNQGEEQQDDNSGNDEPTDQGVEDQPQDDGQAGSEDVSDSGEQTQADDGNVDAGQDGGVSDQGATDGQDQSSVTDQQPQPQDNASQDVTQNIPQDQQQMPNDQVVEQPDQSQQEQQEVDTTDQNLTPEQKRQLRDEYIVLWRKGLRQCGITTPLKDVTDPSLIQQFWDFIGGEWQNGDLSKFLSVQELKRIESSEKVAFPSDGSDNQNV